MSFNSDNTNMDGCGLTVGDEKSGNKTNIILDSATSTGEKGSSNNDGYGLVLIIQLI